MDNEQKEQPIEVDFKHVKVFNLDGKEIPGIPVAKALGNYIYGVTNTLEMDNIARAIHSDIPTTFLPNELNYVLELVKHERCSLINPLKKGIIDYLLTKLK